MKRQTKKLLSTVSLVLGVFVSLVVAFFVVQSVRRNAAIARVEAMGGSVEIKRVNSLFGPFSWRACWVDLKGTILDEQQVDEFIAAVDQINLSDLRVNMGHTAITTGQQTRIMEPASHLSHRTVPIPTQKLRWVSLKDAADPPRRRKRLPLVVFFENQSNQLLKLYHVKEGKKEFRAEARPGRTLQAVTNMESSWLITDEKGTSVGYFAVDNFVQGPASAVIPVLN